MIEIGQKYGLWTVISEPMNGKHPKVLCRCSCGTERAVQTYHLVRGNSRNCGCLRRVSVREKSGRTPKEEQPGYNSWRGMRERCSNPNHISFPWYGAKGVKVCSRWQESFDAFIADMGSPPPGTQWIERVDGACGYEPGNCVWATPAQQARNTSRNKFINGKVIIDAAGEAGIPAPTVYNRLRRGVPSSEALAK
jgi:hypothetical protein